MLVMSVASDTQNMPSVPSMPDMPNMPSMPEMPEMRVLPIPTELLDRTFGCHPDKHSFVRLEEQYGGGSCFFHSLACLLVQGNLRTKDSVVYLLNTASTTYQLFKVDLKSSIDTNDTNDTNDTFRQVGIMLRRRLANELVAKPHLWEQFCKSVPIYASTAFSTSLAMASQVSNLLQSSVWADTWAIKYTAWRLHVNILFVNPTSWDEPIYCGVEMFDNAALHVFIYWSHNIHFEPVVQLESQNQKWLVHRMFGNSQFVQCFKQQYAKMCKLTPITTKQKALVPQLPYFY